MLAATNGGGLLVTAAGSGFLNEVLVLQFGLISKGTFNVYLLWWLQDVSDSLQLHRWSSDSVRSLQMGDPCHCAVFPNVGGGLEGSDSGVGAGHAHPVHSSSGAPSLHTTLPSHTETLMDAMQC